MNTPQKLVLLVATLAIFGINVPQALPTLRKGTHHPVGPELVVVYAPDADASTPTVPVVRVQTKPDVAFVDTGERVSVYLNNAYREAEMHFAPRWTLLLLLGFGLCFGFAGFAVRPSPGSNKNPTQAPNPALQRTASGNDVPP